MTDKTFLKLFNSARRALENAYSPYSKVKVGAALLMSDGKVYSGCNVENASYGATICAERAAVLKAVSDGRRKIKAVLVVTNQKEIWPPCGMCRQVLAEFSGASTVVYSSTLKKEFRKMKFSDVFPSAFGPGHLGKI
jgi:cytidine deaminase